MKNVLVTGAAGFLGFNLAKRLSESGYQVYAVVRPNSEHNIRLLGLDGVSLVECEMSEYNSLSTRIGNGVDFFFHIAWSGGRYDFNAQLNNQEATLEVMEQASLMGCKKMIIAGSQAEYGAMSDIITEDAIPNPFCDYGAAKVATCYLSKRRAQELNIDWIWGRIFSLYGKYEPETRMLPHLIEGLKKDQNIILSSCNQYWDYLYASDAADAFIALGERGRSGEIYNVASGDYRPLKGFVECARNYYHSKSMITYGDDPVPYVSLRPSITKIKRDTGWAPKISFEKGLELIGTYNYGNE